MLIPLLTTSEPSLLNQSSLLPLIRKLGIPLRSRPQQLLDTLINDRPYQIQLPITFTPYAGSKPCSARCGFCSENLRFANFKAAAQLPMPENYHQLLASALTQIIHIPLGLSLSGLEFSDDHSWAIATIHELLQWQALGGTWTEKACYSNLAGFADIDNAKPLILSLQQLGIERFEVSRHHYDSAINQQMMRFRAHEAIQSNTVFSNVLDVLSVRFSITLVCIVQQQGIKNLDDVLAYLDWAKSLGIHKVIFRELSAINNNQYQNNTTLKFINSQRVSIEPLLEQVFTHSTALNWQPISVETGYYYWNIAWQAPDCQVIFERSDYDIMQQSHASNRLHKLVFHANGNLTADWTPERFVLFRSTDE